MINKEQLLKRVNTANNAALTLPEQIILEALKAKLEKCPELDYQAGEMLKMSYAKAAVCVNLREFYQCT